MQLRRLTRFSRIELETEKDELRAAIEELDAILDDERKLRTVSATSWPRSPRRTARRAAPSCSQSAGQPVDDRRAARGRRRPLLRLPVLRRPAGAHDRRRDPWRPATPGPTTTWSCRPSAPPRAARSGWSPPAAGWSGSTSWTCPTLPDDRERPAPAGRRAGQRASCSWRATSGWSALCSLTGDGPGLALGTRRGRGQAGEPRAPRTGTPGRWSGSTTATRSSAPWSVDR